MFLARRIISYSCAYLSPLHACLAAFCRMNIHIYSSPHPWISHAYMINILAGVFLTVTVLYCLLFFSLRLFLFYVSIVYLSPISSSRAILCMWRELGGSIEVRISYRQWYMRVLPADTRLLISLACIVDPISC